MQVITASMRTTIVINRDATTEAGVLMYAPRSSSMFTSTIIPSGMEAAEEDEEDDGGDVNRGDVSLADWDGTSGKEAYRGPVKAITEEDEDILLAK